MNNMKIRFFATFGSGQLEKFDVEPTRTAVYLENATEGELRNRLQKKPFNNKYCTTYAIEKYAPMLLLWGVELYSIDELLEKKNKRGIKI